MVFTGLYKPASRWSYTAPLYNLSTTILELKNFVEDFVQEREWSQFHNAKNLSMALTIEAGELMDIFKWNTPEECENMMSEKNTRQDATDELADIIIYAIAFAIRNNINISNAIDKKMIRNRIKYPTDKYRGHF